jgi:hypothetical protein
VLYNNPSAAEALCAAGADASLRTPRGTLLDIAGENLSRAEQLLAESEARPDLHEVARQKCADAAALLDVLRRHGG